MKSLKYFFLSCLVVSSLGCERSTGSRDAMPDIELSDISSNGCLNVEKLSALIQRPNYSYPGAMITTDFKVLSESTVGKTSFLTYSAFYYRSLPVNQMGMLPIVTQVNCEKILLQTSSREILTYKVTGSSDSSLKFSLTDEFAETMPGYKREALSERPLVTEYTIDLLPEHSLKIVTKARTLDPVCNGKNLIHTETTKVISWARSSEGLPANYEINPEFLNSVKSLIIGIPSPEFPLLSELSESLSVPEILHLSSQPLREEWKTCR